jgi:GTP-binding protein
VLTVSALTGQRVSKVFKFVDEVFQQYCSRVETGPLNKIIKKAVEKNEPSMHRGRRIKLYYAAQVKSKPPTFVIVVNYPDAIHFSYQRYLVNQIRQGAGLNQTPVRILFRPRKQRKFVRHKRKR